MQAPLIFFTGVHLAGPDAHREVVRAPGSSASRPPRPPCRRGSTCRGGSHGIWKGVDLTGGDDATVIWWDPDATGADEVGRDGTGLYRYADEGARYLPGKWPKKPVGLFDDATSSTVLTQLPPEERAAELPLAGIIRRSLVAASRGLVGPRFGPNW